MKRYNSLDLVKFILSFFVIAIHILPFGIHESGIYSTLNFYIKNYLARIAVPFFFICNGYFLFYKDNEESKSPNRILKKAFKILKLYVIWSIIYLPLSFIELRSQNIGMVNGFIEYIKHFIFSGSYDHLWYLNSLFISLIILSVLLHYKVKDKTILKLSIILYLFGLLGDSYYGLIQGIPILNNIMDLYLKVFITTRNGLFDGLLFVTLGMMIAVNKTSEKKNYGLIFLISLLSMFIETSVLKYFSIPKSYNMLVFLPITVFSFFMLVKDISLKDSKLYRRLVEESKLIYYGHMWVEAVADSILPVAFSNTPIKYIVVSLTTFLIAFVVVRISKIKYFKWIKKLY